MVGRSIGDGRLEHRRWSGGASAMVGQGIGNGRPGYWQWSAGVLGLLAFGVRVAQTSQRGFLSLTEGDFEPHERDF